MVKFFEKINGYHTEVSYKFTQCLDKDIVTFDTLKIELIRELIERLQGSLMKVNIGSKKYPLPLIHRITCSRMLLQTGVKEYISRNPSQSGENQ